MKYTERFFKFPIRIYDGHSMYKAEKEEEKQELAGQLIDPVHVDFAVGYKTLKHNSIRGWMESYTTEQGLDYVMEQGFPCTLVTTKEDETYLCNWTMAEFEEALDNFVERLEEK